MIHNKMLKNKNKEGHAIFQVIMKHTKSKFKIAFLMSKFTQIKTVLKTGNDGKKMKKVELQHP